jgi:hypothetical protein
MRASGQNRRIAVGIISLFSRFITAMTPSSANEYRERHWVLLRPALSQLLAGFAHEQILSFAALLSRRRRT